MATAKLNLAASDVQDKVNPAGKPGYFKIGTEAGQVSESKVLAELVRQEARTLSSIPYKWLRLLDRFRGWRAVRFAVGGETTITPPVKPTGDVQIFKNYASQFGDGMTTFYRPDGSVKPYADRTAQDGLVEGTDWTIDDETGVVTLTAPLEKGDHVVMDFNVSGSVVACDELRLCVLELTATEMLRGYPTTSENITDKTNAWETNAQMFLKRLWNAEGGYRTGLQFFDRMDFVDEFETRMAGGVRKTSLGSGALL